MIKHQKQPRELMLDDKRTITIDPRHWNADMKVTVNTGLGTGSRDRDLQMLQTVLQSQLLLADRFMAAGAFDDAIDMLPLIIQTMEKMAESAGIQNARDYYPEYTDEKVAQLKQLAQQKASQPDPKVQADMAKAQADQQLQVTKLQGDMQMQQAKLQSDEQQGQQKLSLDAQRMQMEFGLKREQLAGELQLKREQLQAELMLKREQMVAELALQRELGHVNAAAKVESAKTSSVHVGGEPG
jgi:hypothetical protein